MRQVIVLVSVTVYLALALPAVHGQAPAAWLNAPPGSPSARQQCPATGEWLLLYWGGQPSPIDEGARSCAASDRIWSNIQGAWRGYSPGQPQASDTWQIETGGAAFLHGGVAAPGSTVSLAGDYEWSSPADAARYQQAQWTVIATGRLNSLTTNGVVVEKQGEQCRGRDGSYLRVEGGLCPVGYFLEIESNGQVEQIRSVDHLRATFAPVENLGEAVSFVGVTTSDLRVLPGNVLDGLVLADGGDYFVQVVRKNTFGCGSHEPTREIYRVTGAGAITRIAAEPQKPPQPGRPALCVD